MNKIVKPRRTKPARIPVLVVEDSADQWLLMRSALAKCFPEIEPVWAKTVAQGWQYLETAQSEPTKQPRLVLLDIYVPRREDGFGLIGALKNHPVHRQIPLVVMSHSNDPGDIAEAYSHSVASYIPKPGTFHQWLSCFYTFKQYWSQTMLVKGEG
jgi:CheY-like chemotaxis protein